MTNSKIDGDLFVGKGGSDAQVDRDATSELGTVHSLTDPITLARSRFQKMKMVEETTTGTSRRSETSGWSMSTEAEFSTLMMASA